MKANLKLPLPDEQTSKKQVTFLEDRMGNMVWEFHHSPLLTASNVIAQAGRLEPKRCYTQHHGTLEKVEESSWPIGNLLLCPIIVTERFSAAQRKQSKSG
jgi:hypothetical protein